MRGDATLPRAILISSTYRCVSVRETQEDSGDHPPHPLDRCWGKPFHRACMQCPLAPCGIRHATPHLPSGVAHWPTQTTDGILFLNVGDTYYSGKGQSQGVDAKRSKRRFGLRAVDESGGMGIGLQRKSLIGIPWRIGIALSTGGWVLRSSIIWHRVNCLPEYVLDRPSRSYEYVLMLAKDRRYFFDKEPLIEQKVDEDMWSIPARPRSASGVETAPFPDELVKRYLEIGCPDQGVVLDPFPGAGTTVHIARSMGRASVGIELNRDFCRHAARDMRSK